MAEYWGMRSLILGSETTQWHEEHVSFLLMYTQARVSKVPEPWCDHASYMPSLKARYMSEACGLPLYLPMSNAA